MSEIKQIINDTLSGGERNDLPKKALALHLALELTDNMPESEKEECFYRLIYDDIILTELINAYILDGYTCDSLVQSILKIETPR